MKLRKKILFLSIILSLNFIFILSQCSSSHCESCTSSKICTECEDGYYLIGTNEYYSNNEITCTNIDLSTNYFLTSDGVYYPCINNEYGYLENNENICYRKVDFATTKYYTNNNKNYFPCNYILGSSIGTDNCEECLFNSDNSPSFICTKCVENYVFVNKDYTQCIEISSLDNRYYKVDDYNYASCSIANCLYCSSKSICIQCNSDYYMVNDDKKSCVSISDINPLDEYYLEDNTYYSCNLNGGVENCKKCNLKSVCIECNSNYALIDRDATNCISTNSINLDLYYTLDEGINYLSCINYPGKHCLECEINSADTSNIICHKCEEGYVFINEDYSQCFLEEDLDNTYYKVDENNYKSCSSSITNCETCESENHCLTCTGTNLGVLDERFDECQDISTELSQKTIFKDDNELYYSCTIITGCSKCERRNECIEPISDNYCLLDGEPIELNKINDFYYMADFANNNYECISCSSITNCLLCSSQNNCYQCKEGYTIINDNRINCQYTAGYSSNEEYFTPDNGRNYYQCEKTSLNEKAIDNCLKCEYNSNTQKNNCIQCKTGYIILDDDGSLCIDSSAISDQINVNKIIGESATTKYYTCSKLMENCDTCDSNENCLTCKNEFVFLGIDTTKCISKKNFTEGHYFTSDEIHYYPCIDNCYECDNIATCITCDEGYELNDFNDKCELILIDDNDIRENCIYITKNINSEDSSLDSSDFNILINNLFNDYYTLYKKDKNYLVKYINIEEDYTALVFKNDQCSLFLYENNMFHVNSSEIIAELKKSITSKDIVQIILIYKNYTSIAFFNNYSGTQINIYNECPACIQKKYSIEYNYKNKLIEDVGEKLTKIISENEIDIFNEKSEFFQTFCKPLQIEGIDIPLNIRNYVIYKGNLSYNLGDITKGDIYACSVQCALINNNPVEYISECECDLYYDIDNFKSYVDNMLESNENSEDDEDSETESNGTEIENDYKFLNNTKDSFEMFTCSKYAFTGDNIKKNAGFYVVLFSSLGQGVCLIILLCRIKINSFAKLLILANPPKNKIENNKNGEEENNNKRIVKRVTDIDYYFTNDDEKKNKNKNIYNNIYTNNNYINNTSIPSTQKRMNSENENQKNLDNSENIENINNGEIHHQRLNIFNNNYVATGAIKLGSKNKNKIDNISSNGNESNNDEDIFNGEKNSEMDYYPVIKFIEYDINAYRDIGYTYEQKDIKQLRKKYEGVKVIQYNLLNKNEKTKLLPLIYKSLLKDHLPHKYGMYYDKRNFFSFYFYLFCLRNPIINLFINSNHNSQNFIPFSVKAIKIIFTGMTILFINALFINQKYIYKKYTYFDEHFNFKNLFLSDKINSSEKLIYAINHTLVNSLLAYIIIMIIDIFLTWLFSIRRRVKNLLDEYYEIEIGRANISRYNKERKNFEKELLEVSDLKKTYIWITGFFYVFIIIFFIYLVNFCSIYKGVVDDLFISGLWTFIIYFFMSVFSSLFITGLRYIGLKLKIKLAYDLSRILMEI